MKSCHSFYMKLSTEKGRSRPIATIQVIACYSVAIDFSMVGKSEYLTYSRVLFLIIFDKSKSGEKRMKKALLVIVIGLFSNIVFAQDVDTIFNGKLTHDPGLSSNTKALDGMMKAIFDEANVKLKTEVYRYNGSFEDAVESVNPPNNSNVSGSSQQPFGGALNMFFMMSESLDPKPMSAAWYEKASAKVREFGDQIGKSWSMTIGENQMENASNLPVGSKISIRTISLASPYLDMDNLKIVEGTWVTELIATMVVTEDMVMGGSDEFEEEWDEPEMDMDIDLPEGAHFVSFDDVADAEMMQGDANYVVEMSTDQVIAFYKNYQKRFLTSEEQSEMASDDESLMITYMTFLQHEGDVEVGDDVVTLTFLPAPKGLLSDALGRNQGTWTLICVNRWVEEDY